MVAQYNNILLQENVDDFKKGDMIKQDWSGQRLELMSMSNLENVRYSRATPELKSDNTGNFYGIPQDNYYFIFPISGINVKQDNIQSIYDIEGDGEYVSCFEKTAKFEKQGDIVKLMKKGKIIAKHPTTTN